MNPTKIRVLGVAPYKGMENLMLEIAKQRDDIELTTFVGDLSFGGEILSKHLSEDYDVIISRGGTAEFLRNLTNIPIVEISVSIYDILRAIKTAENHNENCAIIGFPAITSTAHTLCDLLQYKIDITTIESVSEVETILTNYKNNGCNIIICDTITSTMAKHIGLNPILITSGPEGVEAAFDQAIKLYKYYSDLQSKNYILLNALQNQSSSTIVLDCDSSVYFSNCILENSNFIINYLKQLLPDLQGNSFEKSFHFIENSLYSISLKKVKLHKNDFFIFSVSQNAVSYVNSKHGIRIADCNEMKDKYYNSFYNLFPSCSDIDTQIDQLNISNMPILILGEKGTGKDMVAAKLYFESTAKNNPYIMVNCELINDKSWDFLINNHNSPFCDNLNTIFISNIQALSCLQRKQLLSLILDTNLHKRNRIILSCSQTLKNSNVDPASEFIEYLSCTTLYLPSLRNLKENLISSSSLYLSSLNLDLSKHIVGFEKDAISLLVSYYWPQNFMQLKRVLRELVLLTDSSYITSSTVQSVLEKEEHQFPTKNIVVSPMDFNYEKSLNDIVQDVIHVVLAQCDGNQSQAAKKLGISRTTLWRYLK